MSVGGVAPMFLTARISTPPEENWKERSIGLRLHSSELSPVFFRLVHSENNNS